MKKSTLLALAALLLLTGGFIAAKAPADNKQYEYVSLIQSRNVLTVSGSQNQFEEISVKETTHGKLNDFRPLLKKINEFEAQGYERIETGVFAVDGGFPSQHVLLKKQHR